MPFTAGALALLATAAAGASPVSTQFGPPSTIFGSISDEAGPVGAGVVIEAYVGNTLCGQGETQFTGEGSARVTVYAVDVVSREQQPGCGAEGDEVRIKVGERFASQRTRWRAGPVQLDLTFGSATPVPIPTFTPTPRPANATPGSNSGGTSGTPGAQGTPAPGETRAGGTPGASGTSDTLPGGVKASTSGNQDTGDDGSGFPLWGTLAIAAGAVAAVGAVIGVLAARRRNQGADLG